MPRFSEQQKEQIRNRLLTEGERLFETYGLQKVTIDDIVSAVHIAKATFYHFYDSKEGLYIDIGQNIQQKIFIELETLLRSNTHVTSHQRVRQIFASMYHLMLKYPILTQISSETIELISRKVSKEQLAEFFSLNLDAAVILENHGIQFTCTAEEASCAFQALYHAWLGLQDKKTEIQVSVSELLLNGVIEQIIVNA